MRKKIEIILFSLKDGERMTFPDFGGKNSIFLFDFKVALSQLFSLFSNLLRWMTNKDSHSPRN